MRAGIFPGDSTDYKHLGFLAERGVFTSFEPGFDASKVELLTGGDRLNAQRAVYAISAASWDSLRGTLPFTVVAGHSLGFYTALYAAGVLGYEEGTEIIRRAYDAIRMVAGEDRGGMTAIVGVRLSHIEDICRSIPDAYVANINAATQVVISGTLEALAEVELRADEEGALGIKRLDADAPLHSPLMEGVEEIMRDALKEVSLRKPGIPVINHLEPSLLTAAGDIEDVLCGQLTRKVVWRDAVDFMHAQGIGEFVEVGPSDVLSKIVRWIRRDVRAFSTAEALAILEFNGNGNGMKDRADCEGINVQA